jgi:TetR/AcrR family transcriptional repressor of nem operon
MEQARNTREQIVDKAFQLLLQRGVNGFSYRDISEPLGVKNAAIHYHFPSKKDLVRELIRENHDILKQETAEFMAYGGKATEQMEGLFRFTRQQVCLGRPVCLIGVLSVELDDLDDGARGAIDRFMQDSVNWLTRVLETGREQGEFEFNGCAKSKAFSILAMIQGARQLARIHGKDLLETAFDQVRTDLGMNT